MTLFAMSVAFPRRSRKVVRRSTALRTAFPDFHITIDDLLVDDDKVVMRYRGQGTHRGPFGAAAPTNKAVTYTGIAILRLSNGRIAEEWTEYDSLGLMRQIETIPSGEPSRT
jgi:predicted ester cyclase